MAGLPTRLRSQLAAYGLAPTRRLGQNFLVDAAALAAIVAALDPAPGERVVEVGPGTGLLTEGLLAAGCTVLAVEIDAGLVRLLAQEQVHPRLTVVHGDCLAGKNALHPAIVDFAAEPWSLCANLPYDVSIPVLLNAVCLPRPPRRMVVTVQLEAARRLCAGPGDPAWGASAAVAAASGTGRILRRLPPGCFHPRPRVESAVLEWQVARAVPADFGRMCRDLFAFRRKQLSRALRDCKHAADAAYALCERAGLDPQQRVERLAVDQLLALHAAWAELEAR